jgi:hypothetical protein
MKEEFRTKNPYCDICGNEIITGEDRKIKFHKECIQLTEKKDLNTT